MGERRRSFWAWGFEDRLPQESTRVPLMSLVAGLLRCNSLHLRQLPGLEPQQVPASRMTPPSQLGGFCRADPHARASHTYGKNYADILRGLQGQFGNAPDFVCTPRSESELVQVLEWCQHQRVAVIPYGGGTSVVGGVEAEVPADFNGAVSVDMSGISGVLEVDDVSRSARIAAGSSGPEIESSLRKRGLTLRHYPQSFELSTLGGWLATRAGGHYATRYTHIDDFVESIRMLSPAGAWQSIRVPGSGAGPSPDAMVLGSEGSLGLITEAWMRVRPRARWKSSCDVRFASFDDAVSAVRALSQADLGPSNCRLLDAKEALINQVSVDGSSVLLVAFESWDHPVEVSMKRAIDIVAAHGGVVGDSVATSPDSQNAKAKDAEQWRQSFIDAPYLLNNLVSIGVLVETFETACTWDRFSELRARVTATARDVTRRVCGSGLVSCRITHVYPDGPAPYFTVLAPARPGAELDQWRTLKTAMSDAIVQCGGTITHHHAVGRLHRPWFEKQSPAPFADVLRAAKLRLDPHGILNPGVLVAPQGVD